MILKLGLELLLAASDVSSLVILLDRGGSPAEVCLLGLYRAGDDLRKTPVTVGAAGSESGKTGSEGGSEGKLPEISRRKSVFKIKIRMQ